MCSEQCVLHSELETDQDGNEHLLTGSWLAAGAKVGLLELPPRINVTVERVKQELFYSILRGDIYNNAAARLGRGRLYKHSQVKAIGWFNCVVQLFLFHCFLPLHLIHSTFWAKGSRRSTSWILTE